MSMAVLLTVGLGACAGSSSDTASTGSTDTKDKLDLPVYEVTWNGCIDGSNCVGEEVKAYVWGAPNASDRPTFEPEAALVVGRPEFRSPTQSYDVAFEGFGCFPELSEPEAEKQLYRLPSLPVKLPRQPVGENPTRIPIEVQVAPVDGEKQLDLLAQAQTSPTSVIGAGCRVVQGG